MISNRTIIPARVACVIDDFLGSNTGVDFLNIGDFGIFRYDPTKSKLTKVIHAGDFKTAKAQLETTWLEGYYTVLLDSAGNAIITYDYTSMYFDERDPRTD